VEKLVDYNAMDIKAPLKKYDQVTGVQPDTVLIKKSIKQIMESGLPYEFRTTVVPGLHTEEDIARMGDLIKDAEAWYLQSFKNNIALVNPSFESARAFRDEEMENMRLIGEKFVKKCQVR
jgi:pyruvate formate lyase activating enzyme